jgi:hypothetical protein
MDEPTAAVSRYAHAMGKRSRGAAWIMVTSLLLGGCAGATTTGSSPVATAEPTPSVNPAVEPCTAFAELTDRTATAVVDVWTSDGDSASASSELEALPDEFDLLALSADGAVGERMSSVASILQDKAIIVMSTNPDEYFESIEAVQRACQAEGVEIGVATWK